MFAVSTCCMATFHKVPPDNTPETTEPKGSKTKRGKTEKKAKKVKRGKKVKKESRKRASFSHKSKNV